MRKKIFAQKEAARLAAESAVAAGGVVPSNAATAPSTNASRRIVQMPDEYQPPNKILFVQNLPENAGKDALEVLFKQLRLEVLQICVCSKRKSLFILMWMLAHIYVCYRYANLVEVRTIPGRANIAFVEYTDATSSGVAKDALHNYKFDGEHKIKVTFAKQWEEEEQKGYKPRCNNRPSCFATSHRIGTIRGVFAVHVRVVSKKCRREKENPQYTI